MLIGLVCPSSSSSTLYFTLSLFLRNIRKVAILLTHIYHQSHSYIIQNLYFLFAYSTFVLKFVWTYEKILFEENYGYSSLVLYTEM